MCVWAIHNSSSAALGFPICHLLLATWKRFVWTRKPCFMLVRFCLSKEGKWSSNAHQLIPHETRSRDMMVSMPVVQDAGQSFPKMVAKSPRERILPAQQPICEFAQSPLSAYVTLFNQTIFRSATFSCLYFFLSFCSHFVHPTLGATVLP